MPNKFYQRGRDKEYRISKKLRQLGYDIVQRTAGSHSPIDIIAIDKASKSILLIQAKPSSMSDKAKFALEDKHDWLNGDFHVEFSVE